MKKGDIKGLPSATVLVVDDNKDVVKLMSVLLSRHGLNVLGAYSGPDCLKTVRSRPVDLIILDVMMPEMDGLAVCKELKQIAPSIPVILLTAKDTMETRARAMELGVSEFVAKPVNNDDLVARVEMQLRNVEWEKEIDETSSSIGQLSKTPLSDE